jgi:hypothetical protein
MFGPFSTIFSDPFFFLLDSYQLYTTSYRLKPSPTVYFLTSFFGFHFCRYIEVFVIKIRSWWGRKKYRRIQHRNMKTLNEKREREIEREKGDEREREKKRFIWCLKRLYTLCDKRTKLVVQFSIAKTEVMEGIKKPLWNESEAATAISISAFQQKFQDIKIVFMFELKANRNKIEMRIIDSICYIAIV